MNIFSLSILLFVLTGTSLLGQPFQQAADYAEPGRRFKDCAICPEMVVIPAGSFAMGGSHEVSLPRSFAVDVYEVTVREWNWCATTGGCRADVRTEAVVALGQWLEDLFEDEDSDTVLGLLFLLPDFLKRQGLDLISESPYPVTNVSALHSMGVGEIRTAVPSTFVG
jgi:formylglycine-generating enzyme required for sulfatase activity